MEAYAYEMRSNVEQYGNLEKFINPNIKEEFISQCNKTVEWIYEGEGKHASAPELEERIQKLKSIGDPIKSRQFYYQDIDVYIS